MFITFSPMVVGQIDLISSKEIQPRVRVSELGFNYHAWDTTDDQTDYLPCPPI